MRRERIWITWERHRRTRELASEFRAELFEVVRSGALRYLRCLFETLKLLVTNRPRILFVQSPSYVLALTAVFFKPIFRYKLVIDAHNGVTYRLRGPANLMRRAISASIAGSDLVIVTHPTVTSTIREHGGRVATLPDKMPSIEVGSPARRVSERERPWITVIASYQHDEPIEAILEGALEAPEASTIFVTGRRPARSGLDHLARNPRIEFTGYLDETAYEALIGHSDLLVDISSDSTVLVCGGYEAIAVGVPAVVSDSPVSRDVFRPGFLYADNSRSGYRRAIQAYLAAPEDLKAEMRECRQNFPSRWKVWFEKVDAAVDELC